LTAVEQVAAETPTEHIARELYEYRDLLDWLYTEYPRIYREWKRKK
jgi:hypothetical protein